MSALNEPIAKRIATLFRMLSSDFEGEALAAVAAMKTLFKAEGLTFHDIATVIESCNGEIEERKYSDSDAEIIFNRGVEKGRAEAAHEQIAPADYYDVDGAPRWAAIAAFCQNHNQRLRPGEAQFIDDMAGNTLWREPTEKQAKWLLSIFVKLGGRRSR
jgi:hypothetical protein